MKCNQPVDTKASEKSGAFLLPIFGRFYCKKRPFLAAFAVSYVITIMACTLNPCFYCAPSIGLGQTPFKMSLNNLIVVLSILLR